VAGLTQFEAAALAAHHVAEFNDAVASRNFSLFLLLFTDDAVVRFENVPGAGTLEFTGREAYTRAYAERPPDDKVDISGEVRVEDGDVAVVPFSWQRDGGPGIMRLRYTQGPADALDEWLVRAMTIVFG
jgi:ketosteroid isomerase-like protein